MFEQVFEDREVRRHPNVFGLDSLSVNINVVWQYDIYSAKIERFAAASLQAFFALRKYFPMQVWLELSLLHRNVNTLILTPTELYFPSDNTAL